MVKSNAPTPLTIEQKWKSDAKLPSGFDYMRIGLAVAVLIWHSYQISYGTALALDVWRSPAGLLIQLVLPMFFTLSGFLVTSSLERSKGLSEFLLLRIIRIYPALLVEVVLSAFLLGPIVTKFTLGKYFTSAEFFTYLFNMTGYIHFLLPGVFLQHPLPGIVNTSLWTVPYELECYLLISALVLFGYMRSRRSALAAFIVCTVGLAAWMIATHQTSAPAGSVHGRVLVLCFLAGSILYRFRDKIPYDRRIAGATFLVSILLFRFEYIVFFGPLCAAYFTVWLGLCNPRRTIVVGSGDYSYGTYLYAGPIQQTVVWLLGSSNTYTLNVMLALPITVCFALFSWHAIEKPFLRVKRFIRGRRPVASHVIEPQAAGAHISVAGEGGMV